MLVTQVQKEVKPQCHDDEDDGNDEFGDNGGIQGTTL